MSSPFPARFRAAAGSGRSPSMRRKSRARVSFSGALKHLARPRRGTEKKEGAALADSLDRISALGVSYVSYGAGVPHGLVVHLGAAASSLRHLDLSHLACGSKGKHPLEGPACQALTRTLVRCPALVRLSLASNGLRDETLQPLVEGFAAGAAPALEELDLSQNRLRNGNLLAQLLANSSEHLTSLNVEANDLNDLAVMALSAGLSMNLELRRLNLAGNAFGNDGANALANAILHQRSASGDTALEAPLKVHAQWLLGLVVRLGVHDALEQPSCALLSQHEQRGLRHLDVARTLVTDDGAVSLAEAVRDLKGCAATTVRWLNFSDTKVGTRGRAALEEVVRASHEGAEQFADAVFAALHTPSAAQGSLPARPLFVQGLGLEALDMEFNARFSEWVRRHDIAGLTMALPQDEHCSRDRSGCYGYAKHPGILLARRNGELEEVETIASTPGHDQHSLSSLELADVDGVLIDEECDRSTLVMEFVRRQTELEAEQFHEEEVVTNFKKCEVVLEVQAVESLKIVKTEVEKWESGVGRDRRGQPIDEPEPPPEGADDESGSDIASCDTVSETEPKASECRDTTTERMEAIEPELSPPQATPDQGHSPTEGVGKAKGKGKAVSSPSKGKGKGKVEQGAAGTGKGAPPPAKGKGKDTKAVAVKPMAAPFRRKLYWKQLDLADAQGTIFSPQVLSEQGVREQSPTLGGVVAQSRQERRRSHIDVDALQRMFETAETKASSSEASSRLLQKLQCRAEGVKVLSDNRARNIAIVMRRLSVSSERLAEVLRGLQWEEEKLSSDQMEHVLEAIPTPEEAAQLREHTTPEKCQRLRDVEQMVLPFVDLKRAAARVRLISCARCAQDSFNSTSEQLATIRGACDAIRRSDMLREVLLLALEMGNYINHGDSSKGARGITIGSLLQLRDFKVGRMSSLHFLCAQLCQADHQRNAADVLRCELQLVFAAADIPAQNLSQAVRAFDRDLVMIQAENEAASDYEDGESYAQQSGLLQSVERQGEELEKPREQIELQDQRQDEREKQEQPQKQELETETRQEGVEECEQPRNETEQQKMPKEKGKQAEDPCEKMQRMQPQQAGDEQKSLLEEGLDQQSRQESEDQLSREEGEERRLQDEATEHGAHQQKTQEAGEEEQKHKSNCSYQQLAPDVTDALQLRGSARQRLLGLYCVVERLKERLCADIEETSLQGRELLRFCGVALPGSREVLTELEPFLRQLAEFVPVFAQHWKEVQAELPRYSKLFAETWVDEKARSGAENSRKTPTRRRSLVCSSAQKSLETSASGGCSPADHVGSFLTEVRSSDY